MTLVLYEKCMICPLFVEQNPAAEDDDTLASHIHLHRGTPEDEALDGSHDAIPSGMVASLTAWQTYGPPEMRARFTEGGPMTASKALYVPLAAALLNELAEAKQYGLTEQASGIRSATYAISEVLATDNPQFDRMRFLRAAGLVPGQDFEVPR